MCQYCSRSVTLRLFYVFFLFLFGSTTGKLLTSFRFDLIVFFYVSLQKRNKQQNSLKYNNFAKIYVKVCFLQKILVGVEAERFEQLSLHGNTAFFGENMEKKTLVLRIDASLTDKNLLRTT